MTTMVLERTALPGSISKLFRSPRIRIQQLHHDGDVIISPVIDCADETGGTGAGFDAADILNSLNEVYTGIDSQLDKGLEQAQFLTLSSEW